MYQSQGGVEQQHLQQQHHQQQQQFGGYSQQAGSFTQQQQSPSTVLSGSETMTDYAMMPFSNTDRQQYMHDTQQRGMFCDLEQTLCNSHIWGIRSTRLSLEGSAVSG